MPSATTAAPKPPSVALSLWSLVPQPVREQLKARLPLDCRLIGNGRALVVAVGSGTPLRWLMLTPQDDGNIRCDLWEVQRKGCVYLDRKAVPSDKVWALLQLWAKRFLSS